MKLWTRRKTRRNERRSPWQAVLERLEDRTLLAAPVVDPIPDQLVAVNSTTLSLSVAASDADNVPAGTDPINLSAALVGGGVLPSWLTFTPGAPGSGTGSFTSVGTGAVGSVDVLVTATDSTDATGTDTFTIVAFDGTLSAGTQIANEVTGIHTSLTPLLVPANAFTQTGTDLLTLSATLTNGSALPAWLTFTPGVPAIIPTGTFTGTPLDADIGATNVKLTATSPTGEAAIQIFTINVPLNHTPQFAAGSNLTPSEDAPAQSVAWATGILAGPPTESGQELNFIVTTNNNALFSVLPAVSPDGTLTYTLAANANGTAIVSVKLHDNGGNVGGGVDTSDPQTFNISVTAVNDAPTISAPAAQTTLEDTSKVISGLSFGDVDVGSSDLTVTLTVANGTVTVSTNVASGLTAAQVSYNGTSSVTIIAPLAALNATLTNALGLTYLPSPDFNGSDSLVTSINDGVNPTQSATVPITVTAVNDAPNITLNVAAAELTVAEDAGLTTTAAAFVTVTNFGAANESTQTITKYTVTPVATTGGLTFLTAPSIDPVTRLLTYQADANSNGTATFSVTATDDGGTTNSGRDTSAAQTFVITVGGVNDAPTFTMAGDPPTVNEDVGPQTVANFTTSMSPGSANEVGQTLTFLLTQTSPPGGLTFATPPSIDPTTGTLTYQADDDSSGTATFSVTLSDDGGGNNTSAIQSFTITVNEVNDPPSFTLAGNPPSVPESDGPQTVSNFAQNRSVGPLSESGQTLTSFTVTQTGSTGGLTFLTAPSIDPVSGDLTYEATAGSSGTATFDVTLTDDGDVLNGGDDTSAPLSFTITVNGVNNPPTITAPGDQTTLEDTPLVISGLSFADPDAGAGDVTVTLTATQGTLTISTSVTNGVSAAQVAGNGTDTVTITASLSELNTTLADAAGLTYLPDLDVTGSDTLDITIDDNGNSGSGGLLTANADVDITITGVNDTPSFDPGATFADLDVELGSVPQPFLNFVDNISAGGSGELGQALNFIVTTDNPGLFRVLPAVSPTGTLTFTPAKGFGGVATVTVKIHDDGGTPADVSDDLTSDAQTFTITMMLRDVTYTAGTGTKLKVVVVNGALLVQSNGATLPGYLPAYFEKLIINGGTKDDLINLSGLSPTLYPNLETIVINGGGGKDAITFNAIGTDAFPLLGSLTINGGDGNDLINLTDLPDSLFLVPASVVLDGGAGNDTIFGSELDDAITGGTGNDSLNGGDGIDRLVESANVSFKLTNAKLTGVGTDKLANFEEAELTGGAGANKLDASAFTGKVTLSGGAGNDTLLGGSGDDSLVGGDGKDTLIGGLGNDTLKGGLGNDLLIGGGGVDSLDGEGGTDTILGGKGGPARGGNGLADVGDELVPDLINANIINEAFATIFAFE